MADNKETFVDNVVSVRRVTTVTKGGKRFSFSALVVSGKRDDQMVGIGHGKGREVSSAITKATNKARKRMISVALRGSTIPYDVQGNHGASKVIIRAASKGTGVIAGGAVRAVMDVLGVKDILAKSLGAGNRQNVVKATFNALAKLRSAKDLAKQRGKTVDQLVGKVKEDAKTG